MNGGEPKLLAQEISEAGPRLHLGGDVLAVDRQCHWYLHVAYCHSHAMPPTTCASTRSGLSGVFSMTPFCTSCRPARPVGRRRTRGLDRHGKVRPCRTRGARAQAEAVTRHGTAWSTVRRA